jgi:hypothetical protein
LGNKIKELDSDDDEEEAKAETLQTFEEQQKAMEESHRILNELLSKAQEEVVAKAALQTQGSSTTVTRVTFGDHNLGQQVGVINGGTFSWGK